MYSLPERLKDTVGCKKWQAIAGGHRYRGPRIGVNTGVTRAGVTIDLDVGDRNLFNFLFVLVDALRDVTRWRGTRSQRGGSGAVQDWKRAGPGTPLGV